MRISSALHPRTWFHLVTGLSIRPTLHLTDLNGLSDEVLQQHSVKALVFDADNTLTFHGIGEVHPSVAGRFAELQKKYKTAIFSNCPHHRHEQLQGMFPGRVVDYGMTKPAKAGFQRALDLVGEPAANTMMVGDRALTDILGANRMGMKSALVEPFADGKEPKAITLLRRLERWRLKMPF